MKKLIILILLGIASPIFGQTTHQLDSTILTARMVKDSLDIPWEIIWGPDQHIWTTERYGRVSRINPETGKQTVILNISNHVYSKSEAGMLGMALHPDFNIHPHVFIAYTYLDGFNIKERLVKYKYEGSTLNPLDTLIENIIGNTTHIGCRLIFLKDKTLLMSTGDAQKQNLPQDSNSVVGKILRLNTDGSIPADNPNPNSYIYSKGHRNAQGLWLAPNGKIYSSEHGPTNDDELNILKVGKNYGWPNVAGYCDSPPENAFCNANDVEEPIAAWTPTIAPSDIIWYDHPAIPEFSNKLLMTVLKDKSLISFEFDVKGEKVISEKKYLKNSLGRLRDICISPKGKIYLATNGIGWKNTNPFTHSIIELSNKAYVASIKSNVLETFQIAPNPISARETLNLKFPDNKRGKFTIYDASGRIILSQQLEKDNQVNINTNVGLYFWRIELANGAFKGGKLVVQ